MSSNPVGPVSANSAEWDEAWTSVRRLAEARQSVVKGDDILFISEQAQQDFSEIESASAALRDAQPDLEAWSIPKVDVVQTHKPRSVWLVVGIVWISTILLMAMATLAIASLLR
jgi:hypothetical protein